MSDTLRTVKFREEIRDHRYGDYWETVWYGKFHGWGVCEGSSAAIVEIEYCVGTKGSSRSEQAEEKDVKEFYGAGKIKLVRCDRAVIRFIDPMPLQ